MDVYHGISIEGGYCESESCFLQLKKKATIFGNGDFQGMGGMLVFLAGEHTFIFLAFLHY